MNPGTSVTFLGWAWDYGVGSQLNTDPGIGLWILILVWLTLVTLFVSFINFEPRK